MSKVRNACEELMHASRACRERVRDEQLSSKPLALIREKEKLMKECFEATVELELRQQLTADPLDISTLMNTTDAESSIQSKLTELNQEVQSLSMGRNQTSQLLDCLQKSEHLVKLLFQMRSLPFSTAAKDRTLGLLLEQQTKLVMDVLKDVQEAQQLRLRLDGTRSQRLAVLQENRQLMHKLQSSKITPFKDSDTDMQEESALALEEAKVCLLKHTIQCLIFASGIDWAQDEELLKLTLTTGQSSL